jgi:hypothetical protein
VRESTNILSENNLKCGRSSECISRIGIVFNIVFLLYNCVPLLNVHNIIIINLLPLWCLFCLLLLCYHLHVHLFDDYVSITYMFVKIVNNVQISKFKVEVLCYT